MITDMHTFTMAEIFHTVRKFRLEFAHFVPNFRTRLPGRFQEPREAFSH